MGMIEWYQKGGADSYPPQKKAKLKQLASKWLERLNKEFDGGNRSSTSALYATLKMKYEEKKDEYPTRSFVDVYLQRQLRNQTHKRVSNKSDTIQAVIAKRPNQLLQIDYLYFFWAKDGVEDERGEGPIKVDDDDQPEDTDREKRVDKLFGANKFRGAIVAIDGFSQFRYVEPIEGNINSMKAKRALIKIIDKANKEYPDYKNKIRIIQTDKGSEFMNNFRDYLKDRNDNTNKKYFKHIFGYTGRSQSQGMVERLNGTLKRRVLRTVEDGESWVPTIKLVLDSYNNSYHSTIKTAPHKLKKKEGEEEEDYKKRLQEIETRIYDRALKRGFVDPTPKYKAGDYVRIRVFKPKPLQPTFTTKGGLADKKNGLARFEDNDTKNEFEGVYMIHSVREGHQEVKDEQASENNKPGRATTYRIVHNWSRESTPGSVPAGQGKARNNIRLAVQDSERFDGMYYEKGAYGRNFTATELSRVPTLDGLPIVDNRIAGQEEEELDYEIDRIISRQRTPKTSKVGQKFSYRYTVQYKDLKGKGRYKEPETGLIYESVAGTQALDAFLKKNPLPFPPRPKPSER